MWSANESINATHPDASALAYFLQDAENTVLGTMAECVTKFGLRVLCYIFDGLAVLGASQDHLLRTFRSIAAEIMQRASVAVALEDTEGKVICAYDSQLGQPPLSRPDPDASPKRAIAGGEVDPRPLSKAPRAHLSLLKRIAELPDSCIAWSLLHCCPDLQEVPSFIELSLTAGL